jgi:hypothetical protein
MPPHTRSGATVATRRLDAAFMLGLMLLATSGCRRSPEIAFAHLLDGAASASASVQFADDMQRDGRVPRAYTRVARDAAIRSVSTQREQILDADEIDPQTRAAAAALCARLVSAMQSAVRRGQSDDAELRTLESQLRQIAQRSRAGAGA